MGIIRSDQSLDLLKSIKMDIEAELVLTSYQVRRDQKELIEALAKQAKERQATVVRAIIDEWVEMKLRGC